MSDAVFESLAAALDGYFDKPLRRLPNKLRARVGREFFGLAWDNLSEERRRAVAVQWDNLHDPAAPARIKHTEEVINACDEAKVDVAEWEQSKIVTVRDKVERDSGLRAAKARFDERDDQYKRERGDYLDQSESGPAKEKIECEGERDDYPDESESVAVGKNARQTRSNPMSAEIEAACRILGSGWTPHLVMRELRSYAEKAGSCITEAGPDYVRWRNSSGDNKKLTMSLLRARLSRRATSR